MYIDAALIEARETFRRDGVVVVRRLLGAAEIAELAATLERYIAQTVPRLPPRFCFHEEGTDAIRGLFWMNIFEPSLAAMLKADRLVEVVSTLVEWTPRPFFVEAFMKPAVVGKAVPLHQDIGYSQVSPRQQLSVWVALDRAHADNGATRYYRGTHRLGLLPHVASTILGSSLEADRSFVPGELDEVAFDLDPGDAVIHDGLTLHHSPDNRSNDPRRGLVFGYRGAETELDGFVL
ncbi:phytanoyl-CoA dioxygenase family protein [Sorangium sp. So ce1097]|uniref:phytanoyl-CoA dioxygenase family protein n=1 Tax=Sorangium sp. So ce1097 TaxID=3133330 RepID=UPI003F639F93